MEDQLLNAIMAYFSDEVRFEVFQFVSRDWHACVWNPSFNQSLVLDSCQSSSIGMRLVRFRGLDVFSSVWSRLVSVKLVGIKDPALVRAVMAIPSLRTVEMASTTAECVGIVVGALPRSIEHLSISQVELNDCEEMCIFSSNLANITTLTLSEVFIVKPPGRCHSSHSHRRSKIPKFPSLLEEMDVYISPFPELLNFLRLSLSRVTLEHLSVLSLRCVGSASQSDQLASVISAKVPRQGWTNLRELEVGIVTNALVSVLKERCPSLRRINLSAQAEARLVDIAHAFPQVCDLALRVKSNDQLGELISVLHLTSWKSNIKRLKITWTVVNSIPAESLVKLRIALRDLAGIKCTARSITLWTDSRGSRPLDAFSLFLSEICRGEHKSAQEEWGRLSDDLRNAYSQLVL